MQAFQKCVLKSSYGMVSSPCAARPAEGCVGGLLAGARRVLKATVAAVASPDASGPAVAKGSGDREENVARPAPGKEAAAAPDASGPADVKGAGARGDEVQGVDILVEKLPGLQLESRSAPDREATKIDVPFGEDPARFLDGRHKKALEWIKVARQIGLFKLHAAAEVSKDEAGSEWGEFVHTVDKTWDMPDVVEITGSTTRTAFIDRAGQLISKMPSRGDGPHAAWLQETTAERSGGLQNTLEACLRRHQGEMRTCKVPYRVRWEEGDPWPSDAQWCVEDDGSHSYWASTRTCFELADVFQYYPGNGADLYLWFCSQEVVRPAKKKTQSLKAASVFSGMKEERGHYQNWLAEMKVQIGDEYAKHFGKPFKEIPPAVCRMIKENFRAAFQAALRDTANRNVNLSVFMDRRPYRYPVADSDRLMWAALHDERIVINLLQPDLPEEFREDVRRVFAKQGWLAGSGDGEDHDVEIAKCNLLATITYSCDGCSMAASALTGWEVKPATGNRGWRWGCRACGRNWVRGSPRAIVVHMLYKGMSLSFFSRWPLDHWVMETREVLPAQRHPPPPHMRMEGMGMGGRGGAGWWRGAPGESSCGEWGCFARQSGELAGGVPQGRAHDGHPYHVVLQVRSVSRIAGRPAQRRPAVSAAPER